MSSVDKARARAERLLYSLGIGEVASCRVEERYEASYFAEESGYWQKIQWSKGAIQ